MHTYDERNKPGDELDLLVLLYKAILFLKRFGKLLIFLTLSGIIAGGIYYFITPRVYTSALMLQSDYMSNTEQVEIIKNWNTLLIRQQQDLLAEQWHCPDEILSKVTQIKAEEIKKAGITSQNAFKVQVWVKDTTIWEQLQNCIIKGLKNNEYIQSRVAAKQADLKQLIYKTKEEIGKLDSIKSRIASNIMSGNQSASSFIIDISSVNTQMLSLNEKLVSYENDLKFTEAITVLQKFIKFKKPESPKLIMSVTAGGIAGLLMGYLVAIFIYIKNKLRKFRRGSQAIL